MTDLSGTKALAEPEEGPGGGLTARVMQAVNDHIRAHRLRPGDPLPAEQAFVRDLGVSRTIVREAFRSLSALRIIDVGNGRRARVSPIDEGVLALVVDHAVHTNQVTIQQIFDFRRTLEIRAAGLAALRRTPAESDAILGHVEAMRADLDVPERVMLHDIAFHIAIARASRNPMFGLVVASLETVIRQTWPIGWAGRRTTAERLDHIHVHAPVAEAIAAGDPEAAERAMNGHFDNSVRVLVAAGIN